MDEITILHLGAEKRRLDAHEQHERVSRAFVGIIDRFAHTSTQSSNNDTHT